MFAAITALRLAAISAFFGLRLLPHFGLRPSAFLFAATTASRSTIAAIRDVYLRNFRISTLCGYPHLISRLSAFPICGISAFRRFAAIRISYRGCPRSLFAAFPQFDALAAIRIFCVCGYYFASRSTLAAVRVFRLRLLPHLGRLSRLSAFLVCGYCRTSTNLWLYNPHFLVAAITAFRLAAFRIFCLRLSAFRSCSCIDRCMSPLRPTLAAYPQFMFMFMMCGFTAAHVLM